MTTRESLHALVAALPESAFDEAARLLKRCQASTGADVAFDEAALIAKYGFDDEPLSPRTQAIIAEYAAGRMPPGVELNRREIEELLGLSASDVG